MIVHVLGTKVRKQILKIKSENKISYTEAVKQYRGNVSSTSPHISSRGEFPPLLSENHSSQLDGHKSHSSKDNISAQHHSEEIIETEQRNSLTTFSNSVHFLTFLAEVIQETILAPKRSESIDVFQVIAKVADGKIVDLHWMQNNLNSYYLMALTSMQWNCRPIYKKLPELKQCISQLNNQPDVICIQETHLNAKYQPAIPNYSTIRMDRPLHQGKGRYA